MMMARAGTSMVRVPQHPDQHRPERPILLAVNKELGEDPTLRVLPDGIDWGVARR